MKKQKYIIDTCVFLWIVLNPRHIPEHIQDLLCDQTNTIYLSHGSVWEICIKYGKDMLELPFPPDILIPGQCEYHDIIRLPIFESVFYKVGDLPFIHKDPFDRLLVCHALNEDCAIITPDKHISDYPVKTIW